MSRFLTSGVLINTEDFRPWEKPLKQWLNLMKKYVSTVPADLPYFYLERSNVGLLSAAIWKAGGCSLEEYGEIKHRRDGEKFKGRVDLYANLEGKEFIVEFKQAWSSITRGVGVGAKNEVVNAFQAGKNAIKQSKIKGVPGVIGLFLLPYTRSPQSPNVNKHLREYIDWVLKHIDPEAVAWWFPEDCMLPEYPGVILLLRRPKKPVASKINTEPQLESSSLVKVSETTC